MVVNLIESDCRYFCYKIPPQGDTHATEARRYLSACAVVQYSALGAKQTSDDGNRSAECAQPYRCQSVAGWDSDRIPGGCSGLEGGQARWAYLSSARRRNRTDTTDERRRRRAGAALVSRWASDRFRRKARRRQ